MITKRQVSLLAGSKTALVTSPSTVIANLGFYTIYAGDNDVNANNGLPISGGQSLSFDLRPGQPLYIFAPSAVDVLVLETLPHDPNAVPQNIDLAANLGGEIVFVHTAIPITNVSQLPANPSQSTLAQLQLGTWPDAEIINLYVWQDPISQQKYWISDEGILITHEDQTYMGTNVSANPDYIATSNAGAAVATLGWTTRAIRRINEILGAGLKVQAHLTAIMAGNTFPAAFTLSTFFFQNNNGETPVFQANGGNRAAEGPKITTQPDNVIRFMESAWSDVVLPNTNTPISGATITKHSLWPRLFGQVAGGVTYGSEIDADLVYRFYAPAA